MDPDSRWRGWLLDSLLIFGMAVALLWPLFHVTYLKNWESIDATFIADARFLAEHWPHPRWHPLWYGGTRFDYIYPPALRYGTAALSMLLEVPAARAYHIYTAFFYCLGIAGAYLLVRAVSGSRALAWAAAAATALLSPAILFIRDMRLDVSAAYLTPVRLHVLVKYGEGPHISALSVIGLALAAAHRALTGKRPGALALAACLCALVVSTNFYAAVTLVILFPILFWSLWVTHLDRAMWLRAAAIVLLAYGLTAFWMAPSYLRITRANLRIVEAGGKPLHLGIAVCVAAVAAAISYRLGRGRRERCWPIFAWGTFLAFTGIVLGEHWFNWKVVGAASRLIPELDLALILIVLEAARWTWHRAPGWFGRRAWMAHLAIIVAILAPFQYWDDYRTRSRRIYREEPDYQRRIEYRITQWMAQNLPDVRSHATGSVRFWYNAWHDLAQIGGGSEQGILNQAILPELSHVPAGESGELSIHWMLCFGVDVVLVHDETSEEKYHDYPFPRKFAGLLPVLYDNHQGDQIYKLPRRFPGLARVVERTRVDSLRPILREDDLEGLRAYTSVIESGPDSPATTAWEGTDVLRVRARLNEGELLLVQVSYDPAWRAYSAGRSLTIRRDLLGQMLIEAPPGDHDIRLVFELPLENILGRIASAISAAIVIVLAAKGLRRR